MSTEYRYPIRYKLDLGSFSKEQLLDAQAGGADKVAIISVMGGTGRGTSTIFPSLDGETGKPWSDELWFKQWVMLAHELMNSKTISEGQKAICQTVFETVRGAILRGRENEEENHPR
jgi:hypothetical protein